MPKRRVLTFVFLQAKELEFLYTLQRLLQEKAGLKRPPPLHKVIQSALSDYRKVVEIGANPDLMNAYDSAKVRHRTHRRRAIVDPTGVPRAGPTARP